MSKTKEKQQKINYKKNQIIYMGMDFCETIRIFIPLISIFTKREKYIKIKLPYLKCKREKYTDFFQQTSWNEIIYEVYLKMHCFFLCAQTKKQCSSWIYNRNFNQL